MANLPIVLAAALLFLAGAQQSCPRDGSQDPALIQLHRAQAEAVHDGGAMLPQSKSRQARAVSGIEEREQTAAIEVELREKDRLIAELQGQIRQAKKEASDVKRAAPPSFSQLYLGGQEISHCDKEPPAPLPEDEQYPFEHLQANDAEPCPSQPCPLYEMGDMGRPVALSSEEGTRRAHNPDLVGPMLTGMFNTQVQATTTWCALATTVSAFNSMPWVARPPRTNTAFSPFGYWSQDAIWEDECMQRLADEDDMFSKEKVTAQGLVMEQVLKMTKCFLAEGVDAKTVHASEIDAEQMKSDILEQLRKGNVVAVNVLRLDIGQVCGGHWSPVVAYDEGSDSFLFSDVAKYKYPAVWIPSRLLHAGMVKKDDDGSSRGYIKYIKAIGEGGMDREEAAEVPPVVTPTA